MATFPVLAAGTYPAGSRTLGPVTLPVGLTACALVLDGTTMTDPALRLTVTLDLSLDGGVTWASDVRSHATDPFPVTATMSGGMIDGRTGLQRTTYYLSVGTIPDPTNPNRQARILLTNTVRALTTSGTLTVL